MIKFSKKFEEDYDFYFINKDKFNWFDNLVKIPQYDEYGLSAKECFYIYDSTGILKSCREVDLYKQIINCKKNINLQINIWVNGYNFCLIGVLEYMQSFNGNIPNWVESSFRNQLYKKNYNRSLWCYE